MALYVELEYGHNHAWHVGARWPISLVEISKVISIQADGHELNRVEYLFTIPNGTITIPWSNKSVQAWYGDTAKSIAFALWG